MRKLLILIISGILISCSTTSSRTTLKQVLYDKGSMTKQLESLDGRLGVEVLYSAMDETNYIRIASLKLRNTPVLIGISKASEDSPYFMNVLQNANVTPIGKVLFAKDSKVTRDKKMHVESIHLSQIKNLIVRTYLMRLGYIDEDVIYQRTSIFHYENQSMQLVEYILPSIRQFTN